MPPGPTMLSFESPTTMVGSPRPTLQPPPVAEIAANTTTQPPSAPTQAAKLTTLLRPEGRRRLSSQKMPKTEQLGTMSSVSFAFLEQDRNSYFESSVQS